MENNEQETEEEVEQETPENKLSERDIPRTTPTFDRFREERQKMEAANKKREELLDREENNKLDTMFDGKANAGQIPEVPKEETPKEYRKRITKEMAEGKTEFGD